MHGNAANPHAQIGRFAVFAVTALVGVSLCILAAPADAAYAIRYEKTLRLTTGSSGRVHPVSVSCDPHAGEICVTEDADATVHVFNAEGIETFRTGRFAGLSQPLDATVDAEGRIVALTLVQGLRNTITRLSIYGEPDGYAPAPPAAEWNPRHLILTRDGHYLTLDTDSGLLAKHDARTGRVLWQRLLGGETDNGADLNLGRPAESADGRICVPGGNLHMVLVLDAQGEALDSFGRFGTAPGRMVFPVDAAFGPAGELLVLDRMRHKILVFDRDFAFVTEYGSLGSTPGTFYHPLSLAADGRGRIYVAQGFQGLVQVFSVPGDGAVE